MKILKNIQIIFKKKGMNLKTMKSVEKFEYLGSAGYLEGLESS